MQNALKTLEQVFDLISEDTFAAEKKLSELKAERSLVKNKFVQAKIALYAFIIDSVYDRCKEADLKDKKLLSYFEKEKCYDEAALVLLTKARHYFTNGNVEQGKKLVKEACEKFRDKISARIEITLLTRLAFLHKKRNEHAQQLMTNLEAIDKLQKISMRNSWWYSNFSIFITNIAGVYFENEEYDKGFSYLQQALQIAEEQPISVYNKWNIFSYAAFFYNVKHEYENAIKWFKRTEDILRGNEAYNSYLGDVYRNIAIAFSNLHDETPVIPKNKRAEFLREEEYYLQESAKLKGRKSDTGTYAHRMLCLGILQLQKKNYARSAEYLKKAFRIYKKFDNRTHLITYYQAAHKLYYEWGLQTNDKKKLADAYNFLLKEKETVQADATKTTQKKLDAIREHYELEQKILNEKLLRQQIEAMNKEIQLTNLNLHEKVLVLEELKTYIQSLKRKELEARQLINTIGKKIDSVKITEQDKAALQQKLVEGNKQLSKILSEKYPALSPLEIRMCTLFQTGMTNKELAKLYGQTEKAYEQHRYRIKKKMKLGAQENLVKFLNTVGAK